VAGLRAWCCVLHAKRCRQQCERRFSPEIWYWECCYGKSMVSILEGNQGSSWRMASDSRIGDQDVVGHVAWANPLTFTYQKRVPREGVQRQEVPSWSRCPWEHRRICSCECFCGRWNFAGFPEPGIFQFHLHKGVRITSRR